MSDLRILTSSDVDWIIEDLNLQQALQSQAEVFRAYSTQSHSDVSGVRSIQTPQRISITSEGSTSLFMPARVDGQGTACKIVSVPKEGGDGLPATTVVMDDYGKVRGVVNARKLTALRNACGSALFLHLCPEKNSLWQILIFGSGAQAFAHAVVITRLFRSINKVTLAVRSINERAQNLRRTLKKALDPIQVELVCTTTQQGQPIDLSSIISEADLIIGVTPSTQPLFPSRHVTPGTRIILVGSYKPTMREIDDELVKRGGKIVVDSREACGHEAGELISAGVKEEDMIELGELVEDECARDEVGEGGDVFIFKSVGLGIQDVAIAKLVMDDAISKGIGTVVPAYDA